MKISKKVQDALNKQINNEFYSAYLYLSASIWCETHNFSGMGHWLRVQFREEQEHAMKLFRYILERGGNVTLEDIKKPKAEFKSALDIFETSLSHEEAVTRNFYDLIDLVKAEKDYTTEQTLLWFIEEQVEEESEATRIVEKLKMVGDNVGGLFIIDKELAMRQ